MYLKIKLTDEFFFAKVISYISRITYKELYFAIFLVSWSEALSLLDAASDSTPGPPAAPRPAGGEEDVARGSGRPPRGPF